jgi:hypothetical protein
MGIYRYNLGAYGRLIRYVAGKKYRVCPIDIFYASIYGYSCGAEAPLLEQ